MFGHSHGLDGGSLAPNQKVTFKSCSPCLAEILQGQHRSVEGLSNRRIGKNSFMSQFSQKARGFEPGRRMELGSDESTVLRKLLQQPQQPPI